MNRKLTNALDDCLIRIQAGESLETCLTTYPDLETDLRPLLEITLSLDGLRDVQPSAAFTEHAWSNIRVRVTEAAAAKPKRQGLNLGFLNRTSLRMAASITLAIVLITTGAVLLPGGPLSPQPALAAESTLSVLSGSVTVTPDGAGTAAGTDGMGLTAGDTVATEADSYAVLTFANGSTLKLEPLTTVTLETITLDTDGMLGDVVLNQTTGQTWSHVENVAPGFSYVVLTPSATAEVVGTQFVTQVDSGGDTVVQTARGQVNVSGQGQTVSVSAGTQSQVNAGQTPETPAPTPPPSNQLTLTLEGLAVGSVVDPGGASTGHLADGYAFNQIPGSSAGSTGGVQTITIPEPRSGVYTVLLSGTGDGIGNLNIQGTHQGEVAFSNINVISVKNGVNYVLTIQLAATGDGFNLTDLQSAQPVQGKTKQKVVVPPGLAKQDDDKTPPGQGADKDTGKDDDKTPPGQDADKDTGKDDDKTPPGQDADKDTGKDDDKTPPGQDADKDTGKDDDKTPPGQDADKDTGKDDDKTPPGQDADKDTGKDDDKTPPGQDANKDTGKDDDKTPPGQDADKDTGKDDDKTPPGQDADKDTGKDKDKTPPGQDDDKDTGKDKDKDTGKDKKKGGDA